MFKNDANVLSTNLDSENAKIMKFEKDLKAFKTQ